MEFVIHTTSGVSQRLSMYGSFFNKEDKSDALATAVLNMTQMAASLLWGSPLQVGKGINGALRWAARHLDHVTELLNQ